MQKGEGFGILKPALLAHRFTGYLEKPSDIHVLGVCRELGLKVFWKSFEAIDGLLVRTEGVAFIAINENRPFVRKRFTLAHEIGHFLMHEGERFDKMGNCTPKAEREADLFAFNLLMPRHLVEETYIKLKSLKVRINTISEMAWIFRVSSETMRLRFKELKLPTENK